MHGDICVPDWSDGRSLWGAGVAMQTLLGRKIVVYTLRNFWSLQWLSQVRKAPWGREESVAGAVDKLLVASSRIFLGTPMSTFTADILRMRRGYGYASCLDDMICSLDSARNASAIFGTERDAERAEGNKAHTLLKVLEKIRSNRRIAAMKARVAVKALEAQRNAAAKGASRKSRTPKMNAGRDGFDTASQVTVGEMGKSREGE